ncbi:MAG: TIGR03761 family integrating conjugative element protein [Gammaproteobacteria bacterium]|nr:TIGR03761 family integrating conjugative element protein [Gammaproteobacteria bacterium]
MQTENHTSALDLAPSDDHAISPDKPGALRGQVWISIQTSHAQRLFHGRKATPTKPAIVGLVGFATRLRVIWQGARDDDPYADWWLIKVHEAIVATGDELRSRKQQLTESLEQMNALDVDIAASKRPYRVPLNFANPYAYRGAMLIAEFDSLVCMALTLRHIGLLQSQVSENIIKASARKLRSLFMIPQSYRLLKINRDLVQSGKGRSQEARKLMGEIPADVLSGARQAPLIPNKRILSSGFAGQVKLHSEASPDPDNRFTNHNDDE